MESSGYAEAPANSSGPVPGLAPGAYSNGAIVTGWHTRLGPVQTNQLRGFYVPGTQPQQPQTRTITIRSFPPSMAFNPQGAHGEAVVPTHPMTAEATEDTVSHARHGPIGWVEGQL
jgi:hypothetical protein